MYSKGLCTFMAVLKLTKPMLITNEHVVVENVMIHASVLEIRAF